MKVLLLGDVSNYHHTLALGLKRAGHDVTVASNGSSWMGTGRDIDITRRSGRLGGARLWVKLNTLLWPQLSGYDVVQVCGVVFIEQRPKRVMSFLDRLRRGNGSVYLTALATDPQYIRMCTGADCPLRYSEWSVGGEPTPFAQANPGLMQSWLGHDTEQLAEYVYDKVDGVATALYEYHLSCSRHIEPERLEYAGIPVDTESLTYIPADAHIDSLRVMWACHKGREAEKGADRLLEVLKDTEAANKGAMHLDIVQNVPLQRFQSLLDSAHIVTDQLYSYTPATTALMAMAKGKVVISGGEPEYYDFIGETGPRPIINPDPRDLGLLRQQLQQLIDNPGVLRDMSQQSRRLVEKHNSLDVVASRYQKLWDRTLR